jgi:two-component system chemotaxis response regulator CheY
MHLIDACGAFDIIEAEDGEHAWELLGAEPACAICFCDLRMPRLSGLELLERIRSDPRITALPFVLVTSATDTATVEQAAQLGATGYLVKPFQAEQVRQFMGQLRDPGALPELCEPVQQSTHRLGIDAARLLIYLGGFQTQLGVAGPEIAELLARDQLDSARLRILRLHAGCQTLGLTSAAAALGAAAGAVLVPEQVGSAISQALRATIEQSGAVRDCLERAQEG